MMWKCASCDIECPTLAELMGHIGTDPQCLGKGVVINFDEKIMIHYACIEDLHRVCGDMISRWKDKHK